MSKKEEHCFYCGVEVIQNNYLDRGEHTKISNSRSPDHFFPKNHPLYNKHKTVIACIQCNFTKNAGDPIKFIQAIKSEPLPEWGIKGETVHWYIKTGYDMHEWRDKK